MSKTLIIGGVAGGATAAARLRRLDEEMEIIVFERGDYISYANCGLPYYIGDVIKSRDALLLQTPERMKSRFNIEVRTNSNVVEINAVAKTIVVESADRGRYEEKYDDLVIATGSSPFKPPIPGIDGEGIYTLWNVNDTDRVRAVVDNLKPKKVAVVGGGFIGLEMVENLHERGVEVVLVEALDQVMPPLDFEMAQLVHQELAAKGVQLLLGEAVSEFKPLGEGRTELTLKSGQKMDVDMVVLSIGVRPNNQLAASAELTLNARGGIVVDSYLRTSKPSIWAAGDVVEIEHFITKTPTMIPLAGPANKQGRIVADNIVAARKGEKLTSYIGSMGTAIAKVFDLDVAMVGLNEKALKTSGKRLGVDYHVAIVKQKAHAGYYPDAKDMYLKLLFRYDGKIYGAQIVGQEGVDKRIDVLATAITLGGTVEDLKTLELAYAPPYSSAKDPVNMLGFTAGNILDKLMKTMLPAEADELFAKGELFILDVTENDEHAEWAVKGAYHIPLGEIRARLSELPKDKKIAVYCAAGVRAYNASRILMQHGFEDVVVLTAGKEFYRTALTDFRSTK